jgi:hypothetical protein
MTIYAGETLIITNTMTLDGDPVEVDDVDSVDIIIFDSEGEEVVEQTPMSWNGTDERFEYQWDTSPADTPLEAGTYRAKIIVFGLAGEENWEFMRIRLARNPVGS